MPFHGPLIFVLLKLTPEFSEEAIEALHGLLYADGFSQGALLILPVSSLVFH